MEPTKSDSGRTLLLWTAPIVVGRWVGIRIFVHVPLQRASKTCRRTLSVVEFVPKRAARKEKIKCP
jgi:hypothetical protein